MINTTDVLVEGIKISMRKRAEDLAEKLIKETVEDFEKQLRDEMVKASFDVSSWMKLNIRENVISIELIRPKDIYKDKA